jgi:hypothetical protein
VTPHTREGVVPVAVSFDGYLWSKQDLTLKFYHSGFRLRPLMEYSVLIGLLVSMIALAVYLLRQPEEVRLPANRWTLHQGQIVMIDEHGFLDFLLNIAFK